MAKKEALTSACRRTMKVDKAITTFCNMSREGQIAFLVSYAHWLTVVARDTYEAAAEGVTDPARLRRINEIQHRVTGHLQRLLDDDPERYPDDVLTTIIVSNGDSGLMWAFEQALKQIKDTS